MSGILGSITVLVAAYYLFRPNRKKVMLTAQDEVAVRALLREHGEEDSLGYFATRRDKAAIFALRQGGHHLSRHQRHQPGLG